MTTLSKQSRLALLVLFVLVGALTPYSARSQQPQVDAEEKNPLVRQKLEQWDATGVDPVSLLHKLVATVEEVDYSEMLEWFGLRFAPNDDPRKQ